MPVRSIQFPSTIPKTSSFPANALSSSRMSVNCVKKADSPRQQTASEKADRKAGVDVGGSGVPFIVLRPLLLPVL